MPRGQGRRLLADPWVGRSYILRTLSEPFEKPQAKLRELVRFSILRPTLPMWPDWASMALVTFPERKVTRLPGRNPATPIINWAQWL